jgi:para-aminobenzoate synthetase component 1
MDAPHVTEVPAPDLPRVFAAMNAAAARHILWLDSADAAHPYGRYSFLCCDPDAVIGAFADIRAALGPLCPAVPGLPPFQGGAAGLIFYDGRAFMGLYTQVLAVDHAADRAWLITHGDIERNGSFIRMFIERNVSFYKEPQPLRLAPTLTPAEYEARVARVIEHIREGDIFQANLSQRFTGPYRGPPYAHYLALRARNPAPMGGYFDAGGGQVVASASPERFLRVRAKGRVETCPIKGTLPRGQNAMTLINSAKDRAENVMIVDLMRNDLSRVCADVSVEVAKLCELQTFAKVHHLVSTVTGVLAPGRDALDLLEACWPGGSVTGAPKARAMEIIEALEDAPRRAYCGSLAYIGFDGRADSNILIRTLTFEGGQATLRTGGESPSPLTRLRSTPRPWPRPMG